MLSRRLAPLSLLCAIALLPGLLTGCSDDDSNGPAPAPGAALVASWNVTSYAIPAEDFIPQGMSLVITFNSNGTYGLVVTNDLIGICDPGPNCVDGGDYTATATIVTLDPGTADETTLNYVITGNSLTMNGDVGGLTVTVQATKI